MSITGSAPLAISIGEPSGIGPDLIVSLYARREELRLPPFVVFGDADLLRARAKLLGLDIYVSKTDSDDDLETFADALPVRQVCSLSDTPGELEQSNALGVIESIKQAVQACTTRQCRGLITAPIHKASLYSADFKYPGHTEFLAELCSSAENAPKPVMMLATCDLRAIPLTVHVPLSAVPKMITRELIVETCHIAARDLKERFGISKPRICVTGLNPHAGEDGSLGTEDRFIIAPAIVELRKDGIEVDGPLPADTVFHPPHWRQYDVVIAMYHDQALIPVKALGFDQGVNVTLGLPIVRTSPDHGTALDLAGTGKASTNSMLAAIRLANDMSAAL